MIQEYEEFVLQSTDIPLKNLSIEREVIDSESIDLFFLWCSSEKQKEIKEKIQNLLYSTPTPHDIIEIISLLQNYKSLEYLQSNGKTCYQFIVYKFIIPDNQKACEIIYQMVTKFSYLRISSILKHIIYTGYSFNNMKTINPYDIDESLASYLVGEIGLIIKNIYSFVQIVKLSPKVINVTPALIDMIIQYQGEIEKYGITYDEFYNFITVVFKNLGEDEQKLKQFFPKIESFFTFNVRNFIDKEYYEIIDEFKLLSNKAINIGFSPPSVLKYI